MSTYYFDITLKDAAGHISTQTHGVEASSPIEALGILCKRFLDERTHAIISYVSEALPPGEPNV